MTQIDPDGGERPRLAAPLKFAIIAVAVLGLVAVLYGIGSTIFHPGPKLQAATGPAGSSITAVDPPLANKAEADLHVLPPPGPAGQGQLAPDQAFTDAAGKPVKLADFKGKVVVLNLWATWCAPCRKEMPSLAKLAAAVQGKPVQVVALSIDNAAATDKAKAFIAQNAPLAFYQDVGSALPFKFDPPVEGFPTTVVFDKTGRVRSIARSDLDWGSEPVKKIVTALAAE